VIYRHGGNTQAFFSSQSARLGVGQYHGASGIELVLAAQPELITPVLQVVQRAPSRYLIEQAGIKADEDDCGSVT
jgi:hypothetical protein